MVFPTTLNDPKRHTNATVVANAKLEGLTDALNMCKSAFFTLGRVIELIMLQLMMHTCLALHYSFSATCCLRFHASESPPLYLDPGCNFRSKSELVTRWHVRANFLTALFSNEPHLSFGCQL